MFINKVLAGVGNLKHFNDKMICKTNLQALFTIYKMEQISWTAFVGCVVWGCAVQATHINRNDKVPYYLYIVNTNADVQYIMNDYAKGGRLGEA